MKRMIITLLGLAAFVAPMTASAEQIYGNGNGYGDAASGVIDSVNGGAVTLQNGQTVFLKDGTQIGPSGQRLQAGERIRVRGYDAGNGNINAQAIQILGDGGYGYGNHNRYDGYGHRNRDEDRGDRRRDDRHDDDDD